MGGHPVRSVDSWLSRFCYRHPRLGIPNLMRYVVFANVIVFVMDMFSSGTFSNLLAFNPILVLHGQIWRLVTFLVVPEPYNLTGLGPVWFAFSMLFYYFLGTSLERSWGTTKFTVFYGCGALLTLIAAFLSYGLTSLLWGDLAAIFSAIPITMGTVNFSILLAFATLFPDAQFRIYFIIPIKAKWMAVFYLALRVWAYMRLAGPLLLLLLPVMLPLDLAALGNYLLFFWSDVSNLFGRANARRKHQTSAQTINFKKAQKKAKETKGYLHKCAVCGITDADNPNMEFRYCSKCNGYYCYCMDHINSHIHVE